MDYMRSGVWLGLGLVLVWSAMPKYKMRGGQHYGDQGGWRRYAHVETDIEVDVT